MSFMNGSSQEVAISSLLQQINPLCTGLFLKKYEYAYGSGHKTAAVLLPGFAIN